MHDSYIIALSVIFCNRACMDLQISWGQAERGILAHVHGKLHGDDWLPGRCIEKSVGWTLSPISHYFLYNILL